MFFKKESLMEQLLRLRKTQNIFWTTIDEFISLDDVLESWRRNQANQENERIGLILTSELAIFGKKEVLDKIKF